MRPAGSMCGAATCLVLCITTVIAARADRLERPEVLVKVDATTDPTRHAPDAVAATITSTVKTAIEHAGYATSWPGGLPTAAELGAAHARAYVIASTVVELETVRVGRNLEITCTVSIRVARWNGRDGGEKWEAGQAAQAHGSARATTAGHRERDLEQGKRDCVETLAEDLTSRRIIPFLRRLVVART